MTRKRLTNNRTVKKRERHSLTMFVIFSFAVLIIYTIVELVLSTISGISHDTLTTCLYAAFGGEVLACALIKIFKLNMEQVLML